MASLSARVLQTIRRHDLIPAQSRVVAALSGGRDSVALVHLLSELAATGRAAGPMTRPTPFTLVGVAHLNHGIRGEAADRDEAFCRAFASRLSLAIDVESVDVPALARARRTSMEDAARQARAAFFRRAATRLGADRVAVGHTRDDQAETFLLRVVRGAGARGLAGIYPRAGLVIRPLLDVARAELQAYLEATGIAWCEDETNRDLAIPRNRVRHELVPYLQRYFSPGIVGVLARDADIAREDAAWLDRCAAEAAARIVNKVSAPAFPADNDQGVSPLVLDAVALGAEAPAIARRVLHDALTTAGGRFVGFDHVETLRAALGAGGADSGRMDLPGQRAKWANGRLVLTRTRGRRAADSTGKTSFMYELSVPGAAHVPEAGLTVSAEAPAEAAEGLLDRRARREDTVVIAARAIAAPLTVRSRRPGDAFRPLGLGGRKKLQDFFVDRKIARTERDAIPLVVDATGRIVWVVGHALAHDFRVTEPAEGVVILKATRLGG